jgi:opacity protein-like surface antigen
MKRISWTFAAVLAIGACGASAAWAEDPLGFYIGGGVGESTIRSDDPGFGLPGYYNDHQTAFQAVFGVRPIPFVGAEVEYIDFGQPSRRHRDFNDPNFFGEDSHPRAPVLFGVGYLPIPLPFLDVYAKAGVARLKMDLEQFSSDCSTSPCTLVPLGRSAITQTKFAYGVGVQYKLPFYLTVRAEYERISSPFGDPDAFMVNAFFRF